MKYLGYIAAAYAVFFLFLVWDIAAPYVRVRSALRSARLRMKRDAARTSSRKPS